MQSAEKPYFPGLVNDQEKLEANAAQHPSLFHPNSLVPIASPSDELLKILYPDELAVLRDAWELREKQVKQVAKGLNGVGRNESRLSGETAALGITALALAGCATAPAVVSEAPATPSGASGEIVVDQPVDAASGAEPTQVPPQPTPTIIARDAFRERNIGGGADKGEIVTVTYNGETQEIKFNKETGTVEMPYFALDKNYSVVMTKNGEGLVIVDLKTDERFAYLATVETAAGALPFLKVEESGESKGEFPLGVSVVYSMEGEEVAEVSPIVELEEDEIVRMNEEGIFEVVKEDVDGDGKVEVVRELKITAPPTAIVATNSLNVRSGPGTEFNPPTTQLPKDSKVIVTGQEHGWFRVAWLGENGEKVEGWISGSEDLVNATDLAKQIPEVPNSEVPSVPEREVKETSGGEEGVANSEVRKISETVTTPDGQARECLGFEVGSTRILVDQLFIDSSGNFSPGLGIDGGHKEAGETFTINPELPEAESEIAKIGDYIHAVNLGIVDRKGQYDPVWHQRYLDAVAKNPSLTYELKGNVPFGDQGMYTEQTIGQVNPNLPVTFIVLSPKIDGSQIDSLRRQSSSSPYSYGLQYAIESFGLVGLEIKQDGALVLYSAPMKREGENYIGIKRLYPADTLQYPVLIAGAEAHYRSPLVTQQQLTPNITKIEFYRQFRNLKVKDPYKGGYKMPYLTWTRN